MPVDTIGTKTRLFNEALRLFAMNGVENVSMRGLAYAAGIKAASIYNHYSSKEQIIEACYDFFVNNYGTGRLNKEQYIPILQNGSKEEIVNILNTQFSNDQAENMGYAMTMVFSRIYTDAKARDTYTEMLDHSLEFLHEFFNAGITIGRFKDFDVMRISMIFLSVRLIATQTATIKPERFKDRGRAQQEMFSDLVNLIPFQY